METSPLRRWPALADHSSWLIPSRTDAPELLDLGVGTAEDVKANFEDLRRINRYLGGLSAITHHLYPRLASLDGAKVVDIGTGSGDLLPVISRWAWDHQINVKLLGLDLSARNLCAADSHVQLVQADALQLPFKPNSVDYFVSSLLLHHLAPEQVKTLLARTFKTARRGIIMSDLTRGYLPLLAFKLSQPIFARSFLTRHDGAVSIRRAYTPAELTFLAHEAGLANARVYRHPLWRMTLVADK